MTNTIELTNLFTEERVTVPTGRIVPALREWFEADPYAGPGDSAVEQFNAAILAEDYNEAVDRASELGIGFDLPR